MIVRHWIVPFASIALSAGACAKDSPPQVGVDDKALAREVLEEIISIRTAKGHGQTPAMAKALADRMLDAGFSSEDIDIPTTQIDGEKVAALVVRYRAASNEGSKPIALIGHMDVVDASAETWTTDPYQPTEKDGYLYGRGSVDNKAGIAALATTFVRLKRQGWSPSRDLIIAFSGDEETGMSTTRTLTAHKWVSRAEFALNSDAGAGSIGADGKGPAFSIQSAEKTYATFFFTAKNRGGHSSAPRADNAIFDLADAIKTIESHRFPVSFNEITRSMAADLAQSEGGSFGAALEKLLDDPNDEQARATVEASPLGAHFLYTTCVPTMLSAGSAENALPQRASVTVNCRILPGSPVSEVKTALMKAIGDPGISIEDGREAVESPISPVREDLFASLRNVTHAMYPGAPVKPSMSSGGTDGREFRKAGIPTYGAGAIALVLPEDSRAHGIDERLPLETYYKQLVYWEVLLKDLAGPPKGAN